jgi:5'-methylthioadenosine phosphorylase
MRRIAVITGTGLYDLQSQKGPHTTQLRVDTPYGSQPVRVHEGPRITLFHVNRHGDDHTTPPHRLDPRRTIDALAKCRVESVLSLQNTGGLRPQTQAGHLVVPHDLIDLSHHPHHTFFDDEVVHIDMSKPYCPTTRSSLLQAVADSDWDNDKAHDRGVYVTTRGPRFETPAETAHLAGMGDIVGMTGAGEATLARERGLCYAALAFVANPAAGVAGPKLDARGIQRALAEQGPRLADLLDRAAHNLAEEKTCTCSQAPTTGRLSHLPARR